jgi:hypothetical protein
MITPDNNKMQQSRHGQYGASLLILVFDGQVEEAAEMKRHWSFVVCDTKYLYPAALLLLTAGVATALIFKDPVCLNRVGNFIIGIGVWMSIRYTLREGINRHKDLARSSPTVPGTNALNSEFFNQIAFSIGDARLQLHGFGLVVLGSVMGSFGDLILRAVVPARVFL